MRAKLTGNKAKLASSLSGAVPFTPMINTEVMRKSDPTYDPNKPTGVSGILGTAPKNPLITAANDIMNKAKETGKSFMDGLAGKIGDTTTPAAAPAPVTTESPAPISTPAPANYDAQKNTAFEEYGKAIAPDAKTKNEIDIARDTLSKTYGGETTEQAYNRMRQEKGVPDAENRLKTTDALLRTNVEGARNAQEQVFSSGGGVTNAGVQQLRAYNSRDFIRNISDLSNARANNVDELNMRNTQIDTVLRLRQADRAQTQQDLKDKIELLSNKITPAEKELLKAKLDSKLRSIETRESAEVDRIKKINEYQMQRDYTLGDITSADPLKRRVAVESAVNEVMKQYEGLPFARSSSSIASDVQKLVEGGMSLTDAIKQNVIDPIQSKPEYKDFIAKKMGTQDKYDYKPIQSVDGNGNMITTGYIAVNKLDPSDYRMMGVDNNGMPSSSGSSGGGMGSSSGGGGSGTNYSTGGGSGMDFRGAASKYPNEASIKNNNPAGITFNSTFAQTLKNAGIQFTKGTDRPAAEGGAYFGFPNVEEGFKAYDLLWNSPSYTNLTVGAALKRWGTGALPGVDTGMKVSALSPSQKSQLQMSQIKKESPGMFKELTNAGIFGPEGINFQKSSPEGSGQGGSFDPANGEKYKNVLSGTYPSGIKPGSANAMKLDAEAKAWRANQNGDLNEKGFDPGLSSYYLKGTSIGKEELEGMGKTQKEFLKESREYIKDYGAQRYGKLLWNIQDPDLYSTLIASPEGKKLETQIPEKMSRIDAMNRKFKELNTLIEKNGPEAFTVMGGASDDMAQLWSQIGLDAKEALNLGVLNGPDLEIIKAQIPDPSSFGESLTTGWGKGSRDRLIARMERARASLNAQATDQLTGYGINKLDTAQYQ